MLSGSLDDVLDMYNVGQIAFPPRRHVANGWQHSVVAGFHNDGLGKKDAQGHDVFADAAPVQERGNSLLSLWQCSSNVADQES